ncbi:MAG: HAD-IIIA family hydrolase [Flavobacteriales bacterium]|jgi:3-deoxy-D-manno-octulosonate 8-phosphate phosphatase (KDO 8-P phosphatase)|nr:HAD-IIIA family hydrolase [Flavobacteriales bacterium]
MENFKETMKNISTFVFDVDGVLTNGKVIIMPNGDQLREMHTRDGYAMKLAMEKGYKVAIITGGRSESVRKRMHYLGIYDVYLGAHDKMECLKDLMACYDIQLEDLAYMGDDLPDWEVMKEVALPACPKNAATEIKNIATYISPLNGGEGCVREFIEHVMRTKGDWEENTKIESH